MAEISARKKAIDFLILLNTAITNIRLYPPTSAIILNSVDRIFTTVTEALASVAALEYEESGNRLLVQGSPLPEKDQQKLEVGSFLPLLNELGIRSMTFCRGIADHEITGLLQAAAKSPVEIAAAGGFHALLSQWNVTHIHIVEKKGTATDIAHRFSGGVSIDGRRPLTAGQVATDSAVLMKRESECGRVQTALNRILEGGVDRFAARTVADTLPDAFTQLLADGRHDVLQRLSDRMGEALFHQDPRVRGNAAGSMAQIDAALGSAGQLEQRIALSEKLAEWIRFETELIEAFAAVTGRMQDLSRILIEAGRADAIEPVLKAYHLISTGDLKRNEAFRDTAVRMLQFLSTDTVLDLLIKEPNKAGQKTGKDDLSCLVILGATAVERLLERLHDSRSMPERTRIVQVISRIGRPALEPVLTCLKRGGPWYFIRNLVLLLGRVGDERHLHVLAAQMTHSDYRVQREAVKSIQVIGGADAGAVLFDCIDTVDGELKGYLITVIGALQYREAVPRLIEMLSRPVGAKKADRDELREKICEALGRMKSDQAVPALEKIVRTRGFWSRKNPERVRSAAAGALANIKHR